MGLKADGERQIVCDLSYRRNLKTKNKKNPKLPGEEIRLELLEAEGGGSRTRRKVVKRCKCPVIR